MIGELLEICSKLHLTAKFIEARVEGPAHVRKFTFEVKIGGNEGCLRVIFKRLTII